MKRQKKYNYSPEQRAYFAEQQWVDTRSLSRPVECCDHGEKCWVKHGPPAYGRVNNSGFCLGCGGRPKPHHHQPAIKSSER